jgi:hypothetical protein
MIPSNSDAVEFLILNKGLEVSGIDSATGEFLYSFTPKIKDLMPELYKAHLDHVNSQIMFLWENGFVNVDFLSDNPRVTLTEKAFNTEEISKLSEEDRWSLEEIKRLMKR